MKEYFLKKALIDAIKRKSAKKKVRQITSYETIDPLENVLDKEEGPKPDGKSELSPEEKQENQQNSTSVEEAKAQLTGPNNSKEGAGQNPNYKPKRQAFCIIYHIRKLNPGTK